MDGYAMLPCQHFNIDLGSEGSSYVPYKLVAVSEAHIEICIALLLTRAGSKRGKDGVHDIQTNGNPQGVVVLGLRDGGGARC